jgi:hypothetical protein
MKNKSIIFGVLLVSNILFSQNAVEDFRKINEAYKITSKISMNLVYTLYENHSTQTVLDKKEGEYKKDKNKYYNKLMNAETIVNGSQMLSIHSHEKAMVLSPSKPLQTADISGVNLEQLLKVYKKIDFINKSESEKIYVVYFKDGSNILNKFEVHFNPKNYLITKLKLYYNRNIEFSEDGKGTAQKPRLEIEFNNIDTNPHIGEEVFSIEKYVMTGKKPKLQPLYQHYKLIESKI